MLVIRVIKEVVSVYVKFPIARSAAALSYYITLSVFPFLICASVILGSLSIQETDAFELLEGVVPDAAYSILFDYLNNISGSGSMILFALGLTAMLTSSSAAFRTFTGTMGEIQGKMRFTGIMELLISFVFSIVLLGAIYGSALIVISGDWLINLLETHFHITEVAVMLSRVRFLLLFLILFAVIYSVYLISAPKQTKHMSRLPGALAAAIILVATSMIYSQLITVSIRYEVLYGSLASFIILMVWLYTCAFILLMANVINISSSKTKEMKNPERLLKTGQDGEAS